MKEPQMQGSASAASKTGGRLTVSGERDAAPSFIPSNPDAGGDPAPDYKSANPAWVDRPMGWRSAPWQPPRWGRPRRMKIAGTSGR